MVKKIRECKIMISTGTKELIFDADLEDDDAQSLRSQGYIVTDK